jgi:hypothetical protein
MSTAYLEKLSDLLEEMSIAKQVSASLEVKHFFNGAALYANRMICASWSPAGLAFKLSDKEVAKLISTGKAVPLKYFEKGYVKKGYALFVHPSSENIGYWKKLFLKAIKEV